MFSLPKKFIFFFIFFSFTAFANPSHEKYFFLTTPCLLNKISAKNTHKTLAKTNTLALIETNEAGLLALIAAKNTPGKTPCGGFMDVSTEWLAEHQSADMFLKKQETLLINPAKDSGSRTLNVPKLTKNVSQGILNSGMTAVTLNYTVHYPEVVNQLLTTIDSAQISTDLAAFSNTNSEQFPDRYPNSNTGSKAADWLQNKITTLAKEYKRDDVTVYTVATGKRYRQPSVVVKIGNSNAAGIVIGAHMDTYPDTSRAGNSDQVKPGADDDGSGSMTVMAIARTLIANNIHFKKPIYIIWYAAEEFGLVGSGYVVQDFLNKKIPVEAVLQFDMTGFAGFKANDPTMWLVTDFVNPDLTNYLATLITTYVKQPVGLTKCGYACSDHASWSKAGIKAGFPFEAEFGHDNPYIHKPSDTMSHLSLSHMTDFARLGVAFAVELGEPEQNG